MCDPQVAFRHMEPEDGAVAAVRNGLARLAGVVPDIESCQVVIDRPHHSHRHGDPYSVRIHLSVAGHEVSVSGGHRNTGRPLLGSAIVGSFHQLRRAARRLREDLRGTRRAHAPGPR